MTSINVNNKNKNKNADPYNILNFDKTFFNYKALRGRVWVLLYNKCNTKFSENFV